MNIRINALQILTVLALLATAAAAHAGNRGTETPIRSCIAEVGKQANYDRASRVVHWITQLEQKNLVEMKIGIKTAVFASGSGAPVREYTSSCVTGSLGNIVKFRLQEQPAGRG